MKNKIAEAPTIKKKARKTWSKRIENNGINSSVEVEELDNGGYLVRLSKYGTGKNGKYIDENSKFYAKENPLGTENDSTDELTKQLLENNNSLLTQ